MNINSLFIPSTKLIQRRKRKEKERELKVDKEVKQILTDFNIDILYF